MITFSPIGTIRTPFESKSGIPIQSAVGGDTTGKVVLDAQFVDGLKDLDGFSHVHLIYVFDRHDDYALQVRPYMDETPRGLFATRAPKRPNAIGLSLVEIISIDHNEILFRGVDMLNNTPLLDIKPYFGEFDTRPNARCGWLDAVQRRRTISDDRF
jgi:tRNA-Thr(GGU) m(6)t(6)A37 methyltransferase TsaA